MERADTGVQVASAEDHEEWDAQLEIGIAMYIRRFMIDHPAPAGSACAADAVRWAETLLRDGRARLAGVGVRPLRLVSAHRAPAP